MRIILLFVAGCAVALAILAFGRWGGKPALTAREELAIIGASARSENRIVYPKGSTLSVELPGGKRELVNSILNVSHRMKFGSYVWDDRGVAPGPLWVRIDLGKQLLSVFRGPNEIGSTVILYGTDGKPTPTGAFTIKAKAADYHSHTYDAPMPFMLRLTDDGVAVHGSEVRNGSATHGCIGVPTAFAKLLFAQARNGDPVYIMPAPPGSDGTQPDEPASDAEERTTA